MNKTPIEYFKEWSNCLLVTTVAALGWVATRDAGDSGNCAVSVWARCICIISLGLSTVFAMFTLALIPLVAEQQAEGQSFYDVSAKFRLFGRLRTMPVKRVCLPQHVLFITGILSYVVWACLRK